MQRIVEENKPKGPRSDRAAHVRSIEVRLDGKRTALGLVKSKVSRAVTSGRISRSEQLLNAERLADDRLLFAEQMLSSLKTERGESWRELLLKADIALEDLSNAVKQLVARIT